MSELPSPKLISLDYNHSFTCNGDVDRDSCYLSSVQLGEYDVIAAIRMVISCLSILGAISIVSWAIIKKQVCSPRVHPIFVLSLADSILGVLFILGGNLWLRRAPSRVGCFAVSLPTVILECVTVNLTVVYALLAYSSIKRKNVNNLLGSDRRRTQVWSPLKNTIAYLIAWLTPIVVVMIFFGIVSSATNLVSKANSCSCYCLPALGNVLPYVLPRDVGSAMYQYSANSVIFMYGMILMAHYLVCLIMLVVIYRKLLMYIKAMRKEYENTRADTYTYGATGALLVQGQVKAKKRVLYFITVFVVNGFFNFMLAFFLVVIDGLNIHRGPVLKDDMYFRVRPQEPIEKFYIMLLILQSVTVPLQGFLNALVYGWTREDFLHVMAYSKETPANVENLEPTSKNSERDKELEASVEFADNTFTKKEVDMVKKMTGGSRILSLGRRMSGRRSGRNQIQASLVPTETGFSDSEIDER
ncbi:transmembrane protein 116-like [Halichondria panicea]|uniref:transmembrane protein 116-like n=1 Tax=Halichondria panicea TaxID=6063 RepID=UPI00312B6A35